MTERPAARPVAIDDHRGRAPRLRSAWVVTSAILAGVLIFQASPASAALTWGSWEYYYAGTDSGTGAVKCAASRSGVEKVGNPGGPYYPYTASGTFLWKDYLCSNWDLATSGTAQAQNETVKEPFVACGGWTPYSNNPASNPYAEAGAVLVSLCGSGKYFSYGHHWAYRIGAWREDYSNSGTVTI